MIGREYIELMNQEIDGFNTPDQSRRLEEYLKGDPEARTYYRDLVRCLNALENSALVDPPPGLVDGVLARLDAVETGPRTDRPHGGRGGMWAACRELFRLRLRPAFVTTFIGGFVLGLVLFAGSSRLTQGFDPGPSAYVRGTANGGSGDLADDQDVSRGELNQAGLSFRYRLMRDGENLRLHLELDSQARAGVRLSFGAGTGLQHFSTDNPAHSTLETGPTAVELSHEGDGSYDLLFRRGPDDLSPMTLMVFAEGRLIHTETLRTR